MPTQLVRRRRHAASRARRPAVARRCLGICTKITPPPCLPRWLHRRTRDQLNTSSSAPRRTSGTCVRDQAWAKPERGRSFSFDAHGADRLS